MAINPLSVQPPQPNLPFLNQAGGVSREWLYYLLTLLNRTGGVLGISSTELQTQIVSLGVLDSMADLLESPRGPALAVGDVMGDPPEIQPPALPMLLAIALSDPPTPASLSPLLASLLVSDATL